MKKGLKVLIIAAGIIIVLAVTAGLSALAFYRQALPRTTGTMRLEGLQKPVKIYRDKQGVPHVYAETAVDLFFAQGYIHAQERFWQMEFWRRIGAGRLSEYFGPETLDTDIYLRTMGFTRIAEAEYRAMEPDAKRILESYAAGVNAWINSRSPAQLGLEFGLLQLQGIKLNIEPWTPVHSLTWAKMMAQDLSFNMTAELYMVDLIRSVGYENARELFPPYRADKFPFIISESEYKKSRQELSSLSADDKEVVQLLGSLPLDTDLAGGLAANHAFALGKGPGIGTNSIVLAGKLTESGKPLLANDPHLTAQIPSVWYQMDLKAADQYDVCGFSFPGVPGIIIGHNNRISWGFSLLSADVQDYFIEIINPENPSQYRVNDRWEDMEIQREVIEVNGKSEPYILDVKKTRHGPIVNHLKEAEGFSSYLYPRAGGIPGDMLLTGLALSWPALNPCRTVESILQLDRAGNYPQFHQALALFDAPAHNIVYADVDGNIAYQTVGRIPVRKKGEGQIPVPGWNDEYAWQGYIPYEEMPGMLNPEKGYIAASNNAVAGDYYPYYISREYPGFRALRIEQMLQAHQGKFTADDLAAMQQDVVSLGALEIIPYLKPLTLPDDKLAGARDALVNWNGAMTRKSPEAALYSVFWYHLLEEVFADQMPAKLKPLDQLSMSWTRLKFSIDNLLNDPDNFWWDDNRTADISENRDDILIRAFTLACEELSDKLGSRFENWQWDKLHKIIFIHQSLGRSGIGFLEKIFNRGPYPVAGGIQTVNATDWVQSWPYYAVHIPTMRQIIDLGNLANSLTVNTPGQSGHPADKHYTDLVPLWVEGRYYKAYWESIPGKKGNMRQLILMPGRK